MVEKRAVFFLVKNNVEMLVLLFLGSTPVLNGFCCCFISKSRARFSLTRLAKRPLTWTVSPIAGTRSQLFFLLLLFYDIHSDWFIRIFISERGWSIFLCFFLTVPIEAWPRSASAITFLAVGFFGFLIYLFFFALFFLGFVATRFDPFSLYRFIGLRFTELPTGPWCPHRVLNQSINERTQLAWGFKHDLKKEKPFHRLEHGSVPCSGCTEFLLGFVSHWATIIWAVVHFGTWTWNLKWWFILLSYPFFGVSTQDATFDRF